MKDSTYYNNREQYGRAFHKSGILVSWTYFVLENRYFDHDHSCHLTCLDCQDDQVDFEQEMLSHFLALPTYHSC
jgi:hypothetical protein